MKYERGSFITVGSRDTLRGLHPTAQTLYMWLSSYANETGECFPSRKTLSEDVGCSEDTIDKMLLILIDNGLIQKQPRFNGNERTSNLYTVIIVGGPRQKRPPSPLTTATVPARNGSNSNQLTKPIEVRSAEPLPVIEVSEESERVSRFNKPKYPHALEVFSWFPNRQKSWESLKATQEREYAEYLYARGEETVKQALRYCEKHKHDEHFYQITKPSDLEKKWEDIRAYAERNR